MLMGRRTRERAPGGNRTLLMVRCLKVSLSVAAILAFRGLPVRVIAHPMEAQ